MSFLGCLGMIIAVFAVVNMLGDKNIVVIYMNSLIDRCALVVTRWRRDCVRALLAWVSAVLCGAYSAFIRRFKNPQTHFYAEDDSCRVFRRASATQEPSMADQEKKNRQIFSAAPPKPRPAQVRLFLSLSWLLISMISDHLIDFIFLP